MAGDIWVKCYYQGLAGAMCQVPIPCNKSEAV